MMMVNIVIPAATVMFVLLADVAVGHGFFASSTIDGVYYPGYQEGQAPNTDGPTWITDYLVPFYDVYDPQIGCGLNARPANGIAVVHPGSAVSWVWKTHDYKSWTHLEGGTRFAVASCRGDCRTANPNALDWVEIASMTDINGQWPAAILHNGGSIDFPLPEIPNGDYLLRGELLALHFSDSEYTDYPVDGHQMGPEIYPSCQSIRMEGSSGSWRGGQAFSLPGAYSRNAPGHYNPGFWSQPMENYRAAPLNTYVYTFSGGGAPNSNAGTPNTENTNTGTINTGTSNTDNKGTNNVTGDGNEQTTSNRIENPMCARRRRRRRSVKRHNVYHRSH